MMIVEWILLAVYMAMAGAGWALMARGRPGLAMIWFADLLVLVTIATLLRWSAS